jgi:Uma2 family endonuclease
MAIHPTLTPAEYLAFERQQTDAKHEYLYGQITAMSGASREHNLIVGNAFASGQSAGMRCIRLIEPKR